MSRQSWKEERIGETDQTGANKHYSPYVGNSMVKRLRSLSKGQAPLRASEHSSDLFALTSGTEKAKYSSLNRDTVFSMFLYVSE